MLLDERLIFPSEPELPRRLRPGAKIARQIDSILNDYRYGKSMIRSRIEEIIEFGPKHDVRERAADVCRDIQMLNAELERLYRMVYGK